MMLSSDWPAVPYRHATTSTRRRRRGAAGHGAVRARTALAVELGVPLYSASKVETLRPFRAAAPPIGGVVEGKLAGPARGWGSRVPEWTLPSLPCSTAMEDASKRDVVDRRSGPGRLRHARTLNSRPTRSAEVAAGRASGAPVRVWQNGRLYPSGQDPLA